MMADSNEQLALGWVRKEINKSLDQARQGLEAFAENDSDVTQIRFCISCLHQVRGTLQMLEFRGAALFAEEMEYLAQAIADGKFVAKEKALEVLMASMLQLPSYLDRVQSGQRDVPVILLPLLNDLRSSRGAGPVSESAIFTPDISGVEPPSSAAGKKPVDEKSFSEFAKKFRAHYQKGLLNVMRGQGVKEGIQRMHKVLEKLEEVTSGYSVAHLWWVADGFLFSILEKGLYKDAAVHGLLGKIDRHIKRLADLGAKALEDTIPDELLQNLLYYVAKSTSKNEKVVRLKERFNLSSSMLTDDEVEEQRRRLKGPDSGAIETVVSAINDDLINVKDTLDLFVRGGDKSNSKIKDLLPSLKQITDTLGILGLGIPRDVIKQQIATLHKVVESGEEISDAIVMDVAGALLFVEANLANVKSEDVGLSEENTPEELAQKQDQAAAEAQLDDAKMQLLKASRGNLQKAKEKVVDFIASSFNFDLLNDVPMLLIEIQGGLQIVGFSEASELLAKAHEFIERRLLKDHYKPEEKVMDALADIVTSVEYCLENYGEVASAATHSILKAAKNSEAILDEELAKASPEQPPEVTPEPEVEKEVTPTEPKQPESKPAEAAAEPPKQPQKEPEKPQPAKDFDESLIDDDVLEIFLEEAEEELESINSLYPKLVADRDDSESLSTIRRSFHTLKGSGRLVGASLAGELAWSIENMLNRVIDETINLDKDALDVMKDATDFMPKLVDAFSKNKVPDETPDEIMARAHAIAKGEKYVAPTAEEKPAEPVATETPPPVEETPPQVEETTPQVEEQEPEITPDVEVISLEPEPEEESVPEPQLEEEAIELPEEEVPEIELTEEEIPELSEEDSEGDFEPVGVDDVLEISESMAEESDEEDIPALDLSDSEADVESLDTDFPDVEEPESARPQIGASKATEESISSDIDPVLLEIFVHEAEGHLEVITNTIDNWQNEHGSKATDELLRAMHTLKGSAHMAEVPEVADLAGPLESLVKEFKQRDVSLHDDFRDALVDANEYLGHCIDSLKSHKHYISDQKDKLMQVFNDQRSALLQLSGEPQSKEAPVVHRDPELLSIFLAEGMDIVSEAQDLLNTWQNKGSIEAQHNLQAEMHTLKRGANMAMLEEVESLATALESFVSKPDQLTMDDEFYTLGSRALDCVLELLNTAAVEHKLDDPSELIQELKEWHAKKATSQPQIVTHKPEPVEESEEVSETIRPEDVHEAEDEIDEELLEFFLEEAEELIEEIETNLESWSEKPQDLLPVNNLQRNLHTFKGSARMAGIMSVGNLAHALEDLYEAINTEQLEPSPAHAQLSYEVLDNFRNVVEQLGDDGSYDQDESLIEKIRKAIAGEAISITEPETTPAETVEEEQVTETPEQAAEQPAEAEAPAAEGEVHKVELDEDGEEVLEIYLEEAEEILQNMDEALQHWSAEPSNKEDIEKLQRSLHTLKGGARLSNLESLGNLTHELETYFEKVAEGSIEPKPTHIQFVMRGYDVIHKMVDEVGASRMLTTPAAYMEQLDVLSKTGDLPAAPAQTSVPAPKTEADVVPIVKPEKKRPAEKRERKASGDKDKRAKQQEVVRIASDQLESLVNLSGETSIFRARLEQQVTVLRYNLDEMTQALERMREQLRNLEIETDAQIEYRREIAGVDYEEFDPLEFDRYTRQQELTRSLGESAADLANLRDTIDNLASDSETLLLQQGRVNTEMSERLMRTRMVPFESLVPRLRRIVRQIGNELNKAVDLSIVAEGEMDRTVLERMIAPIEHMLRNAMDHGIENPEERQTSGKSETGKIRIRLYREGSEIFIEIQDDGRGLNMSAIKKKALERGLITEQSELSDHELQQMIFEAGFSTAQKVTQISGRGVGMDVVSSEIKQMGGVVEIHSEQGKGATFTVKLPFTVSVNQALMIKVGEDVYAVPLTNIEGIVRVSPFEIQEYYDNPEARFEYAGMPYHMRYMGNLLDHHTRPDLEGITKPLPVLLLHGAEHPTAVQVDELMGSREIVVKSVGQQLSLLSGLSGATILGDGRVVLILDVPALTRRADAVMDIDSAVYEEVEEDKVPTVMVVDDSITVRKVTQRLLQRHDYEVVLAKDGVDALNVLQEHQPDVMLLDIEMPRMDGFELATIIRHDDKLKKLPIIMITSRTGEKHRERAESIGVNRYMGKPYNEVDLLQTIESLLPGKQ
ncbi:Hpt domain-containing protein [Pleionea sediminis]|uniref:Hpt domain-containing protein n=1 Tax=Pleionea sediminis TaxID=2569479 RepID=UPI0011858DE5|nr:Hpt domain-containing protein [Pleionea sediminis]